MIITKLQVASVELDVSSQSSSTCRASRVRRVEPVQLVVLSQSSCALRLARHSQNAWARHVERVESSRVEPSGIWPLLFTLMVINGMNSILELFLKFAYRNCFHFHVLFSHMRVCVKQTHTHTASSICSTSCFSATF